MRVAFGRMQMDKERRQRLHEAAGKHRGSWELDFFILPMIEFEKGNRSRQ